MTVDLIPMPRRLVPAEDCFAIRYDTRIVLDGPAGLPTGAVMMRDALAKSSGLPLMILKGKPEPRCVLIRLCAQDELTGDAAYTLDVTPDGITLLAAGEEALHWGMMTLAQIFTLHGAVIPCLRIEDAPVFVRRGYYLDCSRGRIPTLAQLKRTVDLLSFLKIGELQLYVEHTYLFRGESEAWRGDTPLTAEDILTLDRYCRDRFVELVPSLSSFGHMQRILSTKTHEAQCELPDSSVPYFRFQDMMAHHTLNPADPASFALVTRLVDEYAALFTSRRFNICCDETFDLGRGRSQASGRSKEELYIEFVAALCRHLLAKGITPEFWGDILLHQPETASVLPEGTVCLNWGYDAHVPEAQTAAIAAAGLPQVVCPGVSSWNRLIPDMDNAFGNIRAMSAYGRRYGAVGLLNTDWGDFGHICDPILSLPGIACGASFSWNPEEIGEDEFLRRAGRLLLNDRTGTVLDGAAAIARCQLFSWWNAVLWAEAEEPAVKERHLSKIRAAADKVPDAEAAVGDALRIISRAAPSLNDDGREFVRAVHLAAEGIVILNRIGLAAAGLWDGDRNRLAAELEEWFQAFMGRWREVSREGQLKETLRMVETLADWLRGRERRVIAGTL